MVMIDPYITLGKCDGSGIIWSSRSNQKKHAGF